MTSNPSGSSAGALSSVLPRSEEWPLNVRSSAPPRRRSRPVVLAAASGRGLLSSLRADPRQAVQEDSIRCLVCGGSFRQLTNTHLRVHRLNAEEYKQRFGYNRGRPLMCAELCRLYTDRAVKTGLASRIRERPILVRPELRRRGGTRTIALEELLTRRDVRRRVRETHTTV
jgi:ROS/MUCR transcriptional regulator protein